MGQYDPNRVKMEIHVGPKYVGDQLHISSPCTLTFRGLGRDQNGVYIKLTADKSKEFVMETAILIIASINLLLTALIFFFKDFPGTS